MKRTVALLSLLIAACTPEPPLPAACAVSGLERVGGPISLVDETGRAVTQADFADKPTLLYFGFANCPDVCPTALQTMRAMQEARGPNATPIHMAMVSVDPERDTSALLGQYVASPAFPEGLKGLTGTPAQATAAAEAFKVFAQRRDDPGSAIGYTMDHSRLFYLMDRNWRAAAMFQDSMPPADMAACIDHALAKTH